MLADFEWFQNAVTNLSNDAKRIEVLSEIKIALNQLKDHELKHLAHNLRLNDVFDCLNCSEKEQIDLTCDILTALLSTLDLSMVLGQYSPSLLRAINHPASKVKEMAIKELLRGVKGDDTVSRLCQEEELLLSVVHCLCHEETSVASMAVMLLTRLGTTVTGRAVILSDCVVHGLRGVIRHNDVSRFRVYELVVEIAVHSAESLSAIQQTSLMSELLAELNSNDILVQVNVIELLTKLALCPHGLKFLEQQGALSSLLERLVTAVDHTDALSSLLLPGLLKFFGNVAHVHPKETFAKYPTVVASLFRTMESDDLIARGIAMETIGYIGTTVQGKMVLDGLGETMTQAMKKIGIYIATLPTEWRVRCMDTVANLLELKEVYKNPQALSIVRKWFDHLSPDPMELVTSICKQPFPELCLSGLRVLLSLAEQPWGQELIDKTPGLLEFLLDRTQEASKVCKDAKYDIINIISTSSSAEAILGTSTLLRLKEFVREGAFFVRTQTEVAVEGAS